MKIKRKHINPSIYWLIHPGALALYVLMILFYFSPKYFDEYETEITDIKYKNDFDLVYYYDLNNDGISEEIKLGYNYQPSDKDVCLLHYSMDGNLYNQEKYNGDLLQQQSIIFGDYDSNGFSEVYFLLIRNDSIFLNANELMKANGLFIKDRFIALAGSYDLGKNDIKDVGGTLIETPSSKFKNLVFTIYGGYSKFPRSTYLYHIDLDSLRSSPKSAAWFYSQNQYSDLDEDSYTEITGIIAAPENIHYSMPYTDSACWLMVLNTKNMDFHFPPIRIDTRIGSWVTPVFYDLKGEKYIVSTTRSTNKESKSKQTIQLYNSEGQLINKKRLDDYTGLIPFNPQNNQTYIYFIDEKGWIYQSGTGLELRKTNAEFSNIRSIYTQKYNILDVHNSGSKDVFFMGADHLQNRYLLIYNSDFSNVQKIHLTENTSLKRWHINIIEKNKETENEIFLQADNYCYKIKYQKNPYYLLKQPAYLSFYLLLFLMFYFLQKAQKSVVSKRFETEKKLYEAEKQLMQKQMALSKKQMEPHFMLNMINNIGYLFSKGDKQSAMFYLGKFGNIMRRGLMNAQASQISLEDELVFVEDYLILQKKLMDDELEYSLKVDDRIEDDKIQIPHSLIYTFVENAIKHGLKPKEKDRKLEVRVQQVKEQTKITIQDNGIGRQKSRELHTTDTGKGMEIVQTIIKGYNQLHGKKISYQIEDIIDKGGKVGGTLVEVSV